MSFTSACCRNYDLFQLIGVFHQVQMFVLVNCMIAFWMAHTHVYEKYEKVFSCWIFFRFFFSSFEYSWTIIHAYVAAPCKFYTVRFEYQLVCAAYTGLLFFSFLFARCSSTHSLTMYRHRKMFVWPWITHTHTARVKFDTVNLWKILSDVNVRFLRFAINEFFSWCFNFCLRMHTKDIYQFGFWELLKWLNLLGSQLGS